MNDYKQKALKTAHSPLDPLNIYILLADTDPVFITVVASGQPFPEIKLLSLTGEFLHFTPLGLGSSVPLRPQLGFT